MRKALSVLLALAMLLAVFAAVPMTVSAETSGNFEYTVNSDGTAAITKYTGSAVSLVIPSQLDGHIVTAITGRRSLNGYEGAFYIRNTLKSVTIPDSVTRIGDKAFESCASLQTVKFGSSLTQIGSEAFQSCKVLTNADIPETVSRIGDHAFAHCYALKNVTIHESVTEIEAYTFYDCTAMTNVTLPDSITSIGNYAFHNCAGLTAISIAKTVASIGNSAFGGCESVKSITVDQDNPVYDSRNNCNAIIRTSDNTLLIGCQSTVIPDTVTTIADSAFDSCTSLKSIVIPDSVTSIGVSAFYSCVSLESVTISDSVTTIGNEAFFDCKALTEVTIPDSVETIGTKAFYWCTSLDSVTILGLETEIGEYAIGYKANDSRWWLSDPTYPTIYGYNGSTAEDYAYDNSCYFISLGDKPVEIPTEPPVLIVLGDADGDGTVTIFDATAIQRHLAELSEDLLIEAAADTDGDGSVTIFDATAIQRFLAEMDHPEGIGEPIA